MKHLHFLFVALIIVFAGCKKDSSANPETGKNIVQELDSYIDKDRAYLKDIIIKKGFELTDEDEYEDGGWSLDFLKPVSSTMFSTYSFFLDSKNKAMYSIFGLYSDSIPDIKVRISKSKEWLKFAKDHINYSNFSGYIHEYDTENIAEFDDFGKYLNAYNAGVDEYFNGYCGGVFRQGRNAAWVETGTDGTAVAVILGFDPDFEYEGKRVMNTMAKKMKRNKRF